MRTIAAGSIVALIVAAAFLAHPVTLQNLNNRACDQLTAWAGPGRASGQVVIVQIDEASLSRFGSWPWPRDRMGMLAARTLEAGASAVVFDMLFPQQSGGEEAFAQAIAGKPVVVGYSMRFDGSDAGTAGCEIAALPVTAGSRHESAPAAVFRASSVLCSETRITRAAAGNGFLNAAPDTDGRMRRVPAIIEAGGRYYPSLSLAALAVGQRWSSIRLEQDRYGASALRLDGRVIPLEGPSLMRLRFRGPQRTFPYISAAEVLAGGAAPERLRGKVAVVGGTAAGLERPVSAPVDPQFPGVELQATALDNLLEGDLFSRPGSAGLWEAFLALAAGLASTCLLVWLPLWGALLTLVIGTAAWAGCTLLLSHTGVLLSPLPVSMALTGNLLVLFPLVYLRERKRLSASEEHSREAVEVGEARYRRLVENINDAIIMDDVEGRLVFANRRFREWFGFEDKDIRQVVLEDYVAPECRAALRERHDRRMRGEDVPDHFEYEALRPNGARMWIEVRVTPVEEGGRITGTQSALRDVTERRQIEAKYLQAQKMESVGRLAGSVAHDFNNLLTVIIGYCELLLKRAPEKAQYRSGLEQIRQAGERAADLTQKLLAFSRKQLAQPRVLDLNIVVSEGERMFGRLIGEDVELTTRLADRPTLVMADLGQLHQVLMNLIVNARDAMPGGGKLVIETRNIPVDGGIVGPAPELPLGPYVYLGVSDNGTGMSDEVKQHLFEPFFTTKEKSRGTGLGLATVDGIVRQAGGWIGVTSALGQGTTFHIYLPYAAGAVAAQAGAAAPAFGLQGMETVLIVEDQDSVRQLISTVLGSYGYSVLQAADGAEALARAEQYAGRIHLLITDVVLPGINGKQVAEKLTAARPDLKVLFVSGYTEETIGHHGVLDPGLNYLPKPFSPEALAVKVRAALAGHAPPRHASGNPNP